MSQRLWEKMRVCLVSPLQEKSPANSSNTKTIKDLFSKLKKNENFEVERLTARQFFFVSWQCREERKKKGKGSPEGYSESTILYTRQARRADCGGFIGKGRSLG